MTAGLLAGCGQPQSGLDGGSSDPYRMSVRDVAQAPLAPDIVEVHTHYNLFPWLQFDPADSRPQGFMISALFLVSARTEKGAFGDGVITVRLFRVERDARPRDARVLVHTWTFTPQEALPFRSTKRTVVGMGYQLRLRWPEDVDLTGEEVVVFVEFARPDGKVIRSGPKSLKVPYKVAG